MTFVERPKDPPSDAELEDFIAENAPKPGLSDLVTPFVCAIRLVLPSVSSPPPAKEEKQVVK